MTEYQYRCWAEIDRAALQHNAALIKKRIGPNVEILAVVKADAYGHGMIPVAQALSKGAGLFGVANLTEAIALRGAVQQPIMLLGPASPQELGLIAQHGFIPSISTWEEADQFNRLASNEKVLINFKIDTGMGRMGVPAHEAIALFKKVNALPRVEIHSVSTHLPVSDEDEVFTRDQLRGFSALIKKLRTEAPGNYKVHALQTAGILEFADEPFEIVRPGMLLYGISPLPQFQNLLRPAMIWKTRIALIREMPAGHGISYGRTFITPRRMRVATLAAGYADGYPRHLSNRGTSVLIGGQRCPLLGRVTMDLIMIDVSELPSAVVGDEVVLMGRQGGEEIPCAELAERADTITWEITTRIGSRVQRVYV
jgi:alanine racemase